MAKKSMSLLEAKRDLLSVCRAVARNKQRVYVFDKSKQRFMTISASAKFSEPPIIEMTTIDFRGSFSRLTGLVRLGFCFKLHGADSETVYVRRHTAYNDPLRPVVDRRRDDLVDLMIEKLMASKLVDSTKIQSVREVTLGIVALAINCGVGDEKLSEVERDERPETSKSKKGLVSLKQNREPKE